jgi:hypothetical protein
VIFRADQARFGQTKEAYFLYVTAVWEKRNDVGAEKNK